MLDPTPGGYVFVGNAEGAHRGILKVMSELYSISRLDSKTPIPAWQVGGTPMKGQKSQVTSGCLTLRLNPGVLPVMRLNARLKAACDV